MELIRFLYPISNHASFFPVLELIGSSSAAVPLTAKSISSNDLAVGSFASPALTTKPKFRYWLVTFLLNTYQLLSWRLSCPRLPDASINHDLFTDDIAQLAERGAGGMELLNYFFNPTVCSRCRRKRYKAHCFLGRDSKQLGYLWIRHESIFWYCRSCLECISSEQHFIRLCWQCQWVCTCGKGWPGFVLGFGTIKSSPLWVIGYWLRIEYIQHNHKWNFQRHVAGLE